MEIAPPRIGIPVITPRQLGSSPGPPPVERWPHGWPGRCLPPFNEPCCGYVIVPPDELPCGAGGAHEVPALVLVESTQWTGNNASERVEYIYSPMAARIRYPGGEVTLDRERGRVAFFDAATNSWSVESLESWQAYVDSLADVARSRLTPALPRWTNDARYELVTGSKCLPYDLTVTVDRPDNTVERIEQRLWVTREVAATPEIYDTYRLTMYLLDRQWLDVPVERPGGFIFRNRIAYIDASGGAGAPMQVADAIIVDKKYQLLPQAYFDIPGDEVAMPGNVIPYR